MPELPDILLYLHALGSRIIGHSLTGIRLVSPFLLRSVAPPLEDAVGRKVVALHRLGKRVVFEFDDELFLIFHLMIAGRFRWKDRGAPVPGKVGLLALDFDNGTLVLTEAGTRRQASLHVASGRTGLAAHDPGGIDVMATDVERFGNALRQENHTLKRSLTDPHLFSGIGNAYSDEILFAARLSPFKQTSALTGDEIARLFEATQSTLSSWSARLRTEAGADFPMKVTAFHDGMAVHGRYGQPCPVCGSPVQRVVYAANEANYCATCQTGGRLLADRALSRLLREDWPKTLADLERRKQQKPAS